MTVDKDLQMNKLFLILIALVAKLCFLVKKMQSVEASLLKKKYKRRGDRKQKISKNKSLGLE